MVSGSAFQPQFSKKDIVQAYELFQSYEKNKSAIKGGKVTDLFFVRTGHGLEFVKKYSLKGQWHRFVAWIEKQQSTKESRFAVDTHIEKMGKILEEFFRTVDPKELEELAIQLRVAAKTDEKGNTTLSPAQVLRENLLELGIHLNQLKYRVERSRFEKKLNHENTAIVAIVSQAEEATKKVQEAKEKLQKAQKEKKDTTQLLQALQRAEQEATRIGMEAKEFLVEKNISITPIGAQGPIKLYANRVQGCYESLQTEYSKQVHEIKSQLKKSLKTSSEADLSVVSRIVWNSGKRLVIVAELQKNETTTLVDVLRKNLAFPHTTSALQAIRTTLKMLESKPGSRAPEFDPKALDSAAVDLTSAFSRQGIPVGESLSSSKAKTKEFLAAQKTALQPHINTDEMRILLDTALTLTPETNQNQLIAQIQNTLEKQNRCLLFGGYKNHPMVYEIEKQKNGKYTLRIYNEGAKKPLPKELVSTQFQYTRGFLEFKDISEATLYSTSGAVVGWGLCDALVKLLTKDADDAIDHINDILIETCLKIKPSQQEEGVISHLLQGSHVLQAALLRTYSDKEKTIFQAALQLYHLEKVEQQLAACLQKKIEQKEFQAMRQVFSTLQSGLADVSLETARFENSPFHRALQEKMTLMRDLLDRLESALIACEKTLYTESLQTLKQKQKAQDVVALSPAPELPKEKVTIKAQEIKPTPIRTDELDLLKLIDQLPKAQDPGFSQAVEQLLSRLATLSPAAETYAYINECFCKKLGSFHAFDAVTFTKPHQALQDLHTWLLHMSTGLDAEKKSQPEQYGMLFFALYGLEKAFRAHRPEDRLFSEQMPSILAKGSIYEQLKSLRTQDPFWSSCFQQVRELRQALDNKSQKSADDFFALDLPKTTLALSEYVVDEIVKWIENDTIPIAKKVTDSIKADRKVQTERIAKEITEEEGRLSGYQSDKTKELKKIDAATKEVARLENLQAKLRLDFDALKAKHDETKQQIEKLDKEIDTSTKLRLRPKPGSAAEKAAKQQVRLREEFQKEAAESEKMINTFTEEIQKRQAAITAQQAIISHCKATIKVLDEKIAHSEYRIREGIRNDVRKDPQYWPWGLSKQDQAPPRAWTNAERACYYFCPDGTARKKIGRDHILPKELGTLCHAAVIAKNIFTKVAGPISPALQLTALNHPVDTLSTKLELSPFKDTLARKDLYAGELGVYKEVYQHVYNKPHVVELEIPYKVTIGLSKTEQPLSTVQKAIQFVTGESKVELKDELRELCQLHCNKDIQIDSVISYFQENPKKLTEPEGRMLFCALLFESDLLRTELQNAKTRDLLVSRMRSLLHDSIASSVQLKDTESAASVLWIAATVQKYVDSLLPDVSLNAVCTAHDLFALVENFAKPQLQHNWPVLFESVLAASKQLKFESLDTKDQQKFFVYSLLAQAIGNKAEVAKDKKCELRLLDANTAHLMLKERLQKTAPEQMLAMLNEFAPPILGSLYPTLKQVQFEQVPKQVGVFKAKDNTILLSLTDGVITSTDPSIFRQYVNPLPRQAQDLLRAQGIYENLDDMSHLRCYKEDAIVSIIDTERKCTIKVDLEKNQIFIKGKAPHWYHHTAPDKKVSIGDNEILKRLHQWVDTESKALCLVDPLTLEPVYQAVNKNKNIKDPKTNYSLVTTPPTTFSSFEDPACTLYWADTTGAVQQIDFARLGLTLVQKKGAWVQKGAEQWQVAPEQFVAHMYDTKGFVVFTHQDTGEKRVLFPVWNLEGDKTSCRYTFNIAGEPVGRTVSCRIEDDLLVPDSIEARYYVSRIMLERQNIDVAERLLYAREAEVTSRKLHSEASFQHAQLGRKLTTQERYKAIREEKRIEDTHLKNIALNPLFKDSSPRTLRLRMHALYLLTRNEAQFPKEALKEEAIEETAPPTPSELKAQVHLALDYLALVADARALEPHQELIALQSIERAVQKQLIRQAGDAHIDRLDDDIVAIHIKKIQERISALKEKLKTAEPVENQPVVAKSTATTLIGGEKFEVDDQARYRMHRLEKQFPFNPQALTYGEFRKNLPFIVWECDHCTSFEAAKTSNMVSLLEQLSQFSDHPYIRSAAQALLNQLCALKGSSPSEIHRDLLPLGILETACPDSPVTREKKRAYFVETQQERASVDTEALFSTTCAEISPHDKMARHKFTEVAGDIAVAKTKLVDQAFTLRPGKDVTLLKEDLETTLEKEVALLSHEEALITNAVAHALAQDPAVQHLYASKKRLFPSIDELCVLCARKNYTDFVQTFYPQISPEGRDNLKSAVQRYLLQKQNVQQLRRSIEAADALINAQEEMIPTLENDLAATLDKMRAYPPDHPYSMIFMVIETTLNIKLRPDQIQNIINFDKDIQAGKNPVMQMIMGAGKTSVVQPILALLLAKPGSLSTVYVPEAQFQAVRQQLEMTLGTTFDQLVFSFPYDIELSKDCDYLDTVLERMKEVQTRGGCLLLGPRQKHSILTSLYEAYHALATNPSRIAEIEKRLKTTKPTAENQKLLQDLKNELQERKDPSFTPELERRVAKIAAIVEFMQGHETSQVDEVDMIMNPKIVFKRPIGAARVFDQDNDFERPKIIVNLLLDLVSKFASDEALRNEVSIDFINAMLTKPGKSVEKRGVDINEKIYFSKVQPILVSSACTRLANKSPHLKKLISENREYIEHFLTQRAPDADPHPEDYMAAVRSWIQKRVTDPRDQELLSALAHAISTVLPTSLLRECDSQYGSDPKLQANQKQERKYVARPYEAPGAPKPTMYADPHEKIIYSVQYYMYKGIPVTDAQEILTDWQNLAKKEMRQRGVKVTETLWYERFNTIMKNQGIPVGLEFLVDPASPEYPQILNIFQKAISKDPQTLQEFLQTRLFEQVTLHDTSVTSTPQTLVGASKAVSGYTGTMHTGILASAMKGLPEVGTDGLTIQAVEKKLSQNVATISLNRAAKGKLADQALAIFKDPEIFTFIDSGGWLKEEKIDDFAMKALQSCGRDDIEGIVYHDKNNEIVCLERNERGGFSVVSFQHSRLKNQPEKRLTIIAQKYETGTNIVQKPTAKAFMSMRKNMTLRDSLQSMFRMRKILHGQSVSIGISDEVRGHMSAQLLDSILDRKEIKAFFTTARPINTDQFRKALNTHKIEPQIQEALVKALDKYDSTKETERDRILSLLDAFTEAFTPDSTSFWRYVAINQSKMEQDKNWAAARYKMREALELPLRSLLVDKSLPLKYRTELFEKAKTLIIKMESDSPFARLVAGEKERTAQEAIEHEVNQYMSIYDEIADARFNRQIAHCYGGTAEAAKTTLKTRLLGSVRAEEISETIRSVDPSLGGEIEAEAQREAEIEEEQEEEKEAQEELEVEAEVQQEVYAQRVAPAKPKEYRALVKAVHPGSTAYDIQAFFNKPFLPFEALLPSGKSQPRLPAVAQLEYSENLFPDSAKLDLPSHASYHLAARYLLALSDGAKKRFILVSHEDAARIKAGLVQGALSPPKGAVLYTLDAGRVAESGSKAQDLFPKDELIPFLTQVKFLTLKSNFSGKEVETIRKLTESDKELKHNCRAFYTKGVDYLQAAKQEYQGSYLQKMLEA